MENSNVRGSKATADLAPIVQDALLLNALSESDVYGPCVDTSNGDLTYAGDGAMLVKSENKAKTPCVCEFMDATAPGSIDCRQQMACG